MTGTVGFLPLACNLKLQDGLLNYEHHYKQPHLKTEEVSTDQSLSAGVTLRGRNILPRSHPAESPIFSLARTGSHSLS